MSDKNTEKDNLSFSGLYDEFGNMIKERVKHPLISPIILSFFLYNYEFLILFLKLDKSDYQKLLCYDFLIFYPILTGITVFLIYPFFSGLIQIVSLWSQSLIEPFIIRRRKLKPVSREEMQRNYNENNELLIKIKNLNDTNNRYNQMLLTTVINAIKGEKKFSSDYRVYQEVPSAELKLYDFIKPVRDNQFATTINSYNELIHGIVVSKFRNDFTNTFYAIAMTRGYIEIEDDLIKEELLIIDDGKLRAPRQEFKDIVIPLLTNKDNSFYNIHINKPSNKLSLVVVIRPINRKIYIKVNERISKSIDYTLTEV